MAKREAKVWKFAADDKKARAQVLAATEIREAAEVLRDKATEAKLSLIAYLLDLVVLEAADRESGPRGGKSQH